MTPPSRLVVECGLSRNSSGGMHASVRVNSIHIHVVCMCRVDRRADLCKRVGSPRASRSWWVAAGCCRRGGGDHHAGCAQPLHSSSRSLDAWADPRATDASRCDFTSALWYTCATSVAHRPRCMMSSCELSPSASRMSVAPPILNDLPPISLGLKPASAPSERASSRVSSVDHCPAPYVCVDSSGLFKGFYTFRSGPQNSCEVLDVVLFFIVMAF